MSSIKNDSRPYATAKYLRISPYKIRTVLALIRGKSVDEAEAILTYCNKGEIGRASCRERV